nr:MAG: DNA pilot protein [Microviridae sp.]
MGFFDGIVGAIAGPLIGGLIGNSGQSDANATNTANVASTNKTNMDIATLNNQTAIDLSNNAMQRKVADLQKAGLNPMLAYTQGGSPVPSLSTPVMQSARVENSAKPLADAMSNLNLGMVQSQIALLQAQRDATTAQAEKTKAETPGSTATSDMAKLDLSNAQATNAGKLLALGNEWTAKNTEANLRNLQASIGQNGVWALNDYAMNSFGIPFPAVMAKAELRQQLLTNLNIKANTTATTQQIGINSPAESFAHSYWGKNLSPYVHDAGSIVNTINSFRSGFK